MNITKIAAAQWLACMTAALLASLASAQCNGAQWESMATTPGVHGTISATTLWDPDGSGPAAPVLVMGGDMDFAGGQPVQNVATWDGVHWAGLGESLPSLADTLDFHGVYALAVHNGELYAGGVMLSPLQGGGPTAVARWDGSHWRAVGEVTGHTVAMVSFQGRLIAAGSLAINGSSEVQQVAAWDGAAWTTVGNVDGTYAGVRESALAGDDGALYLAGQFTSINDVSSNGLALWDGTSWQDMGLEAGEWAQQVFVRAGDVFASTQEPQSSNPFDLDLVRLLDQGQWRTLVVPSTFYHLPRSLCFVGADVFLDDSSGAMRLEGASFIPIGGYATPLVNFRGALFAVGFTTLDSVVSYLGATFDGAQWHNASPGISNFSSVVTWRGALYATADVYADDPFGGPRLVQWNGSSWTPVLNEPLYPPMVVQDDSIVLASRDSSRGLVRVRATSTEPIGPVGALDLRPYALDGVLYCAASSAGGAHVYRFDGSAWAQMGGLFDDFPPQGPSLVSLGGEVYIGGTRIYESGSYLWGVGRWDGSDWVWPGPFDPTGHVFPLIECLASEAGHLIVGGEFYIVPGGSDRYGLAELDGDTWTFMPGGPEYVVSELRVVNDRMLAIPPIDWFADGPLMAWDGSQWTTIGSIGVGSGGLSRDLSTCNFNGDLVLAGAFVTINGLPAGGIARLPFSQCCGSADFNGDGDPATDADIQAFFACLAGNCCPTCGSVDFNSDGDSGTDADIEAFFRVLAGGTC